jgi:aminoglycoside phosphotransferase (APT) family kinase protein
MISSDPRCYPLIELSREQIRAMLQPVSGDAELHELVCVDGGLVNTTYRVTTGVAGAAYALRVYAADNPALEMECELLSHLAKTLPVPRILFADASVERCARPYLVYQWIEGISLNECRRQSSPASLLTLAEPLGGLLAQIGGASLPADVIGGTIQVTALLERAREQLRTGLARERLDSLLADRLRACLNRKAHVFQALDQTDVLVHGDFGGRNILVKPVGNGEWGISGIIDWEEAATGSALWDAGSLFRYPRRYSEEFRLLFERGYQSAGGELPSGWWLMARTIDALRLVAILSEERELPGVFAECVELVQSVVADSDRVAA